MAISDRPALLAPLLHGWREDERVVALVNQTVQASREAGHPRWPVEVASAVRAFVAREASIAGARGFADDTKTRRTRLDQSRSRDGGIG